jgi:16S rRNA (cytosine1402-N4)-methyltransferase
MEQEPQSEHIPVLLDTLLQKISLPQDAVMVDATIGHGGHSLFFGRQLGPTGTILGFDVDPNSIEKARGNLKELSCKVVLVRENFSQIADVLKQQGLEKVDFILADLGFCSAQLEDVEKGLSFQKNMPLDMRLDNRISTTAADIVNRMDEKALADLIYKYGEDRASRRIARFIVSNRKTAPIRTTEQLAMIVCRALGQNPTGHRYKIHPATRTFQALRIAVNSELENLETLLESAPALLKKTGRIAIISFHSLEDKIVKNNFKLNEQNGYYKILTKKPLTATDEEIKQNPRSRSAKLRIAEKI